MPQLCNILDKVFVLDKWSVEQQENDVPNDCYYGNIVLLTL